MKRIRLIACACALVSVAALAQAPSPPLTEEAAALAAILGDSGPCAVQPPPMFSAPIEKSHCAALPIYQFHCCRCDESVGCEPCCVCNTGQPLRVCREICEGGPIPSGSAPLTARRP